MSHQVLEFPCGSHGGLILFVGLSKEDLMSPNVWYTFEKNRKR